MIQSVLTVTSKKPNTNTLKLLSEKSINILP